MRACGAYCRASHARLMSFTDARHRPAITTSSDACLAMARTDSKSPCEAIGKPASMMSTPSSSSMAAIRSFSSWFMEKPGDCSPSRSVVSKILTRLSSVFCMLMSSGPALGAGLSHDSAMAFRALGRRVVAFEGFNFKPLIACRFAARLRRQGRSRSRAERTMLVFMG